MFSWITGSYTFSLSTHASCVNTASVNTDNELLFELQAGSSDLYPLVEEVLRSLTVTFCLSVPSSATFFFRTSHCHSLPVHQMSSDLFTCSPVLTSLISHSLHIPAQIHCSSARSSKLPWTSYRLRVGPVLLFLSRDIYFSKSTSKTM